MKHLWIVRLSNDTLLKLYCSPGLFTILNVILVPVACIIVTKSCSSRMLLNVAECCCQNPWNQSSFCRKENWFGMEERSLLYSKVVDIKSRKWPQSGFLWKVDLLRELSLYCSIKRETYSYRRKPDWSHFLDLKMSILLCRE